MSKSEAISFFHSQLRWQNETLSWDEMIKVFQAEYLMNHPNHVMKITVYPKEAEVDQYTRKKAEERLDAIMNGDPEADIEKPPKIMAKSVKLVIDHQEPPVQSTWKQEVLSCVKKEGIAKEVWEELLGPHFWDEKTVKQIARLFPQPPSATIFAHHNPFLSWCNGTTVWLDYGFAGTNGVRCPAFHAAVIDGIQEGRASYILHVIDKEGYSLNDVKQSRLLYRQTHETRKFLGVHEKVASLCTQRLHERGLLNDPEYRERLCWELEQIDKQKEWDYVWKEICCKKQKNPDQDANVLVHWLNFCLDSFDITKPPKTMLGDFPDVNDIFPCDIPSVIEVKNDSSHSD